MDVLQRLNQTIDRLGFDPAVVPPVHIVQVLRDAKAEIEKLQQKLNDNRKTMVMAKAEIDRLQRKLGEQQAEIERLRALTIRDADGRVVTQGAFNAAMHEALLLRRNIEQKESASVSKCEDETCVRSPESDGELIRLLRQKLGVQQDGIDRLLVALRQIASQD